MTTLAFVLAVNGVAAGHLTLIALGELLAGSVSMGLGAYLSARTENAVLANRIATERYEITHEPGEEFAELRQIYYRKGLRGALLDGVVKYLTADKERWLNAMVRDELGIVDEEQARSPWWQGALVAGAFMGGAFVPIIPFVLGLAIPQLWAVGLTLLVAIALGGIKARYTQRGAAYNALEFLAIVGVAAGVGFGIGAILPAFGH